MTGFLVRRVTYLAHEVHTVGNHDEDDAHVLGKRQQKVAEVFALHHRVLRVEFLYALQAMQDVAHGLTEGNGYLVDGEHAALDAGIEQYGQHGIAAQANLVDSQQGCLQAVDDGVESEEVALHLALLYGLQKLLSHAQLIAFF